MFAICESKFDDILLLKHGTSLLEQSISFWFGPALAEDEGKITGMLSLGKSQPSPAQQGLINSPSMK